MSSIQFKVFRISEGILYGLIYSQFWELVFDFWNIESDIPKIISYEFCDLVILYFYIHWCTFSLGERHKLNYSFDLHCSVNGL